MDTITRLVQAGIRPDCATETVAWYRTQGDDHGLELYIREAEERHRKTNAVASVSRYLV